MKFKRSRDASLRKTTEHILDRARADADYLRQVQAKPQPAFPCEITGAGQRDRRGWTWWVSRRVLWRIFAFVHQRRLGRLALVRVRGVPLVVLPGVFDPGLFVSTSLLLDTLDRLQAGNHLSVLDLGTGTGICAILLALKGARATATDISPLAVRCAKANAILNNVEDRVRILEGDLFAPVADMRFDLVIFNPPFFQGNPTEWSEYAWRGDNVACRFAAELGSHLTSEGKAVISMSTQLDLSVIIEEFRRNGFEIQETNRRRIPGETILVYECTRSLADRELRDEASLGADLRPASPRGLIRPRKAALGTSLFAQAS